MYCFRQHDGWLSYRAQALVKKNHPSLFPSIKERLISQPFALLSSRKGWWVILILIILFYALSLVVDIKGVNCIKIASKTAEALIDQRAANTATIISMTLAVIGFLMGNMAIKEPFAYHVLFKGSRLYFIIYFTLTTIATLIIISTLRDTIENTYYFRKLVVTGTVLVLCVLVLIGYLFGTIIHYTSPKRIWQMLHVELIKEAKENTIKALHLSYAAAQFEKFVKSHNLKEFDFAEALDGGFITLVSDGASVAYLKEDKEVMLVKDINLNGLSTFIFRKRGSAKVYFKRITLQELTSEKDDYVWGKESINTIDEKKELRTYLILAPKPKEVTQAVLDDPTRKHFDEKIEEFAKSGKYRELEDLLPSYIELYKTQMLNTMK